MSACQNKYKLLTIILLLISLSACDKPSYPSGQVVKSILKLCKDEYKLDNVQAKIIGSTLGVYIPMEELVDPDLKLNEKSGKKIEDVALSIHRVITSTDMPVKFYILTARDTKALGAEFVLTGFTYDVVRVRLFDISRGEYFQRILRDFRFNPVVSGEQKIKELFSELNKNASLAETLKYVLYPIYAIGRNNSQNIEITGIESKEISDHESLFYVKTVEKYQPMQEFEAYAAVFPPGFNNEYLFLIDTALFANPLKEVVSKYFYSNNEIRQRNLDDTFRQYADIGLVNANGFPKKDLDLSWFLGEQISRRIKQLFEDNKKLKNDFKVASSKGMIENKVFTFKFNISSDKNKPGDDKIVFSSIIKMTAVILHLYEFKEYEAVEFINSAYGEKKIRLSKNKLEEFRQGKIKTEDLL